MVSCKKLKKLIRLSSKYLYFWNGSSQTSEEFPKQILLRLRFEVDKNYIVCIL